MLDTILDFFYEFFHSTFGKVVLGGVAVVILFLGLQKLSIVGQQNKCRGLDGVYMDGTCTIEDDANEYAKNIIIVTGNTANTPKPQIPVGQGSEGAYDYIKKSIMKNKKINIKIISAATDKSSKTVEMGTSNLSGVDNLIEVVDDTVKNINEEIGKAPKSDGAVYFESIVKAARAAASYKNPDESVVMVFGSGLSDGGTINFAGDKLLSRNASDVILALDQADQLEGNYLSGVRIKWYGIGQTMSPQEELSSSDVEKVRDIYRMAFEELGAEIEYCDDPIESEIIQDNKHTVKPTPTPEVNTGPHEFGDAELSFSADNAQITDENKAEKALAGVIDYAKANPGKRIVVIGYMAAGTCNSANPNKPELSSSRASIMKQFLVSKGVNNTIEVRDGGVLDSEKSECNNGVWKHELADYRRKVVIEFK